MNRRGLLALAAGAGVTGVTGLAGCGRPGDSAGTGTLVHSRAPLPARYQVPLPIPPEAKPVGTTAGADHYVLTQRVADAAILPGRTTSIWGYDGIFPGPTLRGRRGRPMIVSIRNQLPVPTSTHLHGGVVPADSDGFPDDLTLPAGYSPRPPHAHGSTGRLHEVSRDYHYPMVQRAGTLWYHDHRMDRTGPQVWRGLAGLFLIADDEEDALPLPRGDRDLPLLICDRSFEADGSLRYPESHDGALGDVVLVNGAPWPRHEVAAVRYRLRLVNGSNARRYRLELNGGAVPMTQIGSDDGLLAEPVTHRRITTAPGERHDVIVDFTGLAPGTEVTMTNTVGDGATRDVLRFVVTGPAADDTRIPGRLAAVPSLRAEEAVTTRQFDFRYAQGRWTVNGSPYDPGASLAAPRLDTVERWVFTSDFHHPVHVHLAHFQVLSRTGRSPGAEDGGWKDTVDVRPYETVEVLVRFAGFRGRYLVHCHNLEHEDMAMMANFDVV